MGARGRQLCRRHKADFGLSTFVYLTDREIALRNGLSRWKQMRRKPLLAFFALSLFALGPVEVDAQTCSGLYEAANGVLRAYSSYDAGTRNSTPDPRSKKIMIAETNRLLQYASAYFRGADGTDVDSDALISQCDNDTRIAVYKAYVEMVEFWARTNGSETRTVLDDSADMLHRLMLVLQKSNRQDEPERFGSARPFPSRLQSLAYFLHRLDGRPTGAAPTCPLNDPAFLQGRTSRRLPTRSEVLPVLLESALRTRIRRQSQVRRTHA